MFPAPFASPSAARVRPVAALTASLVALSLVACSRASADGPPKNAGGLKRREPARVRVATVEQREMAKTLSTTTVVESEKEIKIFPRVPGVVTEVLAEEGDSVAEGQVLAVLDPRSSQAILDEARVQLAEAKDALEKSKIAEREAEARVGATLRSYEQASRDYDRNENANLISQQALDAMRLTRDTARSDHESAKLAVLRSAVETRAAATTIEKAELAVKRQELEQSWTRIVAPFAGVIASRSIKVGDAATAGAPMFVLTDLDHLRAVFHRPQRELGMFLAAGDGASASDGAGTPESRIEIRGHAEALPGRELAGEILLVSPSIDAQSGSFRVTVRLHPRSASGKDESAARLLPGMLVRLETVTDRHPDALVVPKRALRREGEASLLFVVRDGIAHRVEVTEGYTDDTSVEVVPVGEALLSAGDSVVVVGNRDLEQGSEVIAEGQEK